MLNSIQKLQAQLLVNEAKAAKASEKASQTLTRLENAQNIQKVYNIRLNEIFDYLGFISADGSSILVGQNIEGTSIENQISLNIQFQENNNEQAFFIALHKGFICSQISETLTETAKDKTNEILANRTGFSLPIVKAVAKLFAAYTNGSSPLNYDGIGNLHTFAFNNVAGTGLKAAFRTQAQLNERTKKAETAKAERATKAAKAKTEKAETAKAAETVKAEMQQFVLSLNEAANGLFVGTEFIYDKNTDYNKLLAQLSK